MGDAVGRMRRRLARDAGQNDVAQSARPIRVLHVLHDAGIGGVETAAAVLQERSPASIDYRLATLAPAPDPDAQLTAFTTVDVAGAGINDPRSALAILRWVRREKPDILVASLWRSVLVGVVVRCVVPRTRLVVFLHNTHYKNVADNLSHRVGLAIGDGVFSDSETTRAALGRVLGTGRKPSLVIPIVARSATAMGEAGLASPGSDRSEIRLISWCRLSSQKRLDRALELVAEIRRTASARVHYDIIGPDSGVEADLRRRTTELGLDDVVTWHGALDFDGIMERARGCDAYLQLSDFEGFGMAAIEAMGLGLVPVLTPVGEAGRRATHQVDAIVVENTSAAALDVVALWSDPGRMSAVAQAARELWAAEQPLEDAFAAGCRQIIGPFAPGEAECPSGGG